MARGMVSNKGLPCAATKFNEAFREQQKVDFIRLLRMSHPLIYDVMELEQFPYCH